MVTVRSIVLFLFLAVGCGGSALAKETIGVQPNLFSTIGAAALTGLLSGIVGTLIAPWVNWRIEQRRRLLDSRRDVIRYARENSQPGFNHKKFLSTDSFMQLKDYFSPELVARIETASTPLGVSPESWQETTGIQVRIEIARIEREWGLV